MVSLRGDKNFNCVNVVLGCMGLREFSDSEVLELLDGGVPPAVFGAAGGTYLARGWNGFRWESKGDLFQEGVRSDTPVHGSFDGMDEVVNFVRGEGVYSDRNGFFYGEEDLEEFSDEGFFNDFSCHECVEENLEADVGEVVDPRIFPAFNVYEVESYKVGEEKYRGDMWYQCNEHPEVHLMRSETWYEDSG